MRDLIYAWCRLQAIATVVGAATFGGYYGQAAMHCAAGGRRIWSNVDRDNVWCVSWHGRFAWRRFRQCR